jgi:hypothetical protein
MGLNDRITIQFEAVSAVSPQEIQSRIFEGLQKQSWTDFMVAATIDYKEIKFNADRIEIIRKPTFLNPFTANGRITFIITEGVDRVTLLKCQILPFNGNLPILAALFLAGLAFWSFLVLLIGRGVGASLLAIFPWLIFGLLLYVQFYLTKHSLVAYSKRVIRELTKANP